MSILPRPRPLEVPWSEGTSSHPDTVLVGKTAWLCLLDRANIRRDGGASNHQVAVTLSPLPTEFGNTPSGALKTLVCWAVPKEEDSDHVTVHPSLVASYPHILRPCTLPSLHHPLKSKLLISPTKPVPLTTVFLQALSSSSYAVSVSNPELVLNNLVDNGIVRQGGDIGFSILSPAPPSSGDDGAPSSNGRNGFHDSSDEGAEEPFRYAYKVLMTESALQGVISVSASKLYVIPSPTSPNYQGLEEEDDTPTQSTVGRARTPSSDGVDDKEKHLQEEEFPEIDSSFLANSLPPLPAMTHSSMDSADSLASSITSHAPEFQPVPEPRLLWRDKFMADDSDAEDCVYVRATELARCGIFSGDWTMVDSNSDRRTPQLARAFAIDTLPSSSPPSLLASPTFLYPFLSSHSLPSMVTLSPTPFQSHLPPLPIAQTITLARIASTEATTRIYQPLFVRALRKTFEGRKRVLRVGQLIGVGISKVMVSRITEGDDDELNDELLDYVFPYPSPPDTAVFFRVTNITYDPPPSAASSLPSGKVDVYAAATLGELGCWFDYQRTKMIQTGVEHSLVPDLDLPVGRPQFALSADPNTPFGKLLQLSEACLSPAALEYRLQLCVLLRGQRGVGKSAVAAQVARRLGMHLMEVNCYDLTGESDAKTEGTLRARFERAADCSPCILLLRHLEALARTSQVLEQGKEPSIVSALRECIVRLEAAWRTSGFPVVVIATSAEAERIPMSVQACFKQDIAFEAPSESERLGMLRALLEKDYIAPDVELKDVAAQSAALVAKDLVDLVARVRSAALERATMAITQTDISLASVSDAGLSLTAADFVAGLTESRSSYSESIGAPKIPNVSWDDVGGLAEVKADILDTIQLPLEHPELFSDGLKKRSGILLYGPPGTGKTLLAKAVATSCSLNFFSVKGPELLNMYIGESEANVRRVFRRARDARPCVIFFDELDSVAPKRGNHGDSGGVMDRIVSQLLAELDGMADGSSSSEVFVIGATNRPDLLDPALLRPGRFDRMLYLGVCTTHDAQLKILQALTRKFRLDPSLNLMQVAEHCPFNYTGADFYALCSDAMLKSMARKAEEIDAKLATLNSAPPPYKHLHPMTPQYYLAEIATPEEIDVLVSQRDFEAALSELVPSVTASEMEHYSAVQQRFAGETINSAVNIDRKGKGKGKIVENVPDDSSLMGYDVMSHR